MPPRSTRSGSSVVPNLTLPLIGAGGEPIDFVATINSHGVASLPPVRQNAELATELDITLRLADGTIRTVHLARGEQETVAIDMCGDAPFDAAQVERAVRHVLRLDQDLSDFYQAATEDPQLAWITGGYGRMMRCQSVFEEVIKTILTTNCNWSATVKMTERLVTELGEPDPNLNWEPPFGRTFPTPAAMADRDEAFYREVIRAGYRAPHLVKLSTAVACGELDLESLGTALIDELSDEELEKQLRALPGVGPYAAAHIMHMLGRCSRLVLDSWTRPTYARLIGVESIADAEIAERFAAYGMNAGLAFWLTVTKPWFDDHGAKPALA
jgi:3-methyladenine DNA glycosylase/8-oxoguanine DNA glycosylase